jgi:putative radical SAM enzyme (TIGR03279 family)
MVRVARVVPGSIAEELEIEAGTQIVSVNGRQIDDFLDWEFASADDVLEVATINSDGDETVYEIERPDGEALGVELEPPTVRRCANRCEFCFIEGLPKGLRRPLYVRDDDYRLSFAYGNFATLSNLKERDFARILEYRLSPLYVSVHATPWEARKVLLNNPRVPNIVEQLNRLADGGIQFHGQMVVVPGLNDGDVLEESLSDLWALGDSCLSVAIVPVGLTQFSHLYTGESMSQAHAAQLLFTTERWGDRALRDRGHRWVFGSDELYLLAGKALPDAEFYGDFPQIENGVGAVSSLKARIARGLPDLPRMDGLRIGVVTGLAMREIMPPLLADLARHTGASFDMLLTTNSLFGPTTTTSGLLVGADMLAALGHRDDFDVALIPAETLNDDMLFLDDVPFETLRAQLRVPVYPSHDFLDVLPDIASALSAGSGVVV